MAVRDGAPRNAEPSGAPSRAAPAGMRKRSPSPAIGPGSGSDGRARRTLQDGPRCATIEGVVFPLYSTRPGDCPEPEAISDGVRHCRKLANNVLLLDPPRELAAVLAWRPVRARARWNLVEGEWRPHDLSLQGRGQHRWWGERDHVRIWRAHDGSHAIGQAHREDWTTWPRRHRVHGLDEARDALRAPSASIWHVAVGSQGPGHDGQVRVLQWDRDHRR